MFNDQKINNFIQKNINIKREMVKLSFLNLILGQDEQLDWTGYFGPRITVPHPHLFHPIHIGTLWTCLRTFTTTSHLPKTRSQPWRNEKFWALPKNL